GRHGPERWSQRLSPHRVRSFGDVLFEFGHRALVLRAHRRNAHGAHAGWRDGEVERGSPRLPRGTGYRGAKRGLTGQTAREPGRHTAHRRAVRWSIHADRRGGRRHRAIGLSGEGYVAELHRELPDFVLVLVSRAPDEPEVVVLQHRLGEQLDERPAR